MPSFLSETTFYSTLLRRTRTWLSLNKIWKYLKIRSLNKIIFYLILQNRRFYANNMTFYSILTRFNRLYPYWTRFKITGKNSRTGRVSIDLMMSTSFCARLRIRETSNWSILRLQLPVRCWIREWVDCNICSTQTVTILKALFTLIDQRRWVLQTKQF